ncbi:SRPBCC family protein [Lentibacillus sp. N15]|uniref:SRPBCC family protein n=1 Tax=Lentibacillus songyuanensis TaxID=3136161 RepID=UPI0031BA2AA4
MVQFSNSLLIQANVKDVFRFLERMENFSIWNYAVRRVEKIPSSGDVVGSRYQLLRNQGVQAFEEITITEYIRDSRLVLESIGNHFSYSMTYDLIPQSSGFTRLINKSEIQTSGINNVIFGFMQGNVKREVNQNLHVLKDILDDDKDRNSWHVK